VIVGTAGFLAGGIAGAVVVVADIDRGLLVVYPISL